MTIITIIQKYGMFAVTHKREKGSRLMWYAPNFEVWVVGTLEKNLYEQAANLAMHHAELSGVRAGSLKRFGNVSQKKAFDTETRKMF